MDAAADMIVTVLKRPDTALQPDQRFADIAGWDSLKMVRFVLLLEERLGRELGEDELVGLERILDAQRLLDGE